MERNLKMNPVQKFIKAESSSGVLLFASTILALVLANSPLREWYDALWQFEIGIKSDSFKLVKPLILWINDGLMAIFFFVIGLEVKRELVIGELNSLKKSSLPIFAAIGGMVVPMLLYMFLNENPETAGGWGIPMATDIAFSLAVLTLLGKRVPIGLKIFLTAFAIIDDIGAVLVIALFYTGNIAWNLLFIAGLLLLLLYVLSARKLYNKYLLLLVGAAVWVLFLKAGIHPTIAGVLLAFAVPVNQKINEFTFAEKLKEIVSHITRDKNTTRLPVLSHHQIEAIDDLEDWTEKVQSPLQHLEHRLHGWVAFFIMPVFAFSNAGVNFTEGMNFELPLVGSIAIALFVGKVLGVSLFSLAAIKLKLADLPKRVNFMQVFGVALLSGLGFTMSLFIANLAFADSSLYLDSSKIGIIIGSLAAGITAYVVLKFALPQAEK